jgi:NTE family protein
MHSFQEGIMPTGIVLSGGGAKGDFEVGALRLLYERGVRPDIICGTSVGSINGAKLAEGEGASDQGLEGLEKIWLRLQTASDMYLEEPWLNEIYPPLKAMLTQSGEDGIPSGDAAVPWWVDVLEHAPLFGVLGVQSPFGLGFYTQLFWNVSLSDIANKLERMEEVGVPLLEGLDRARKETSLYNLGPIASLLRGNPDRGIPKELHEDRVATWSQGGVRKLRLAVVSLESGELRYVSETGQVLNRDHTPYLGPSPACMAITRDVSLLIRQKLNAQKQLQSAAPGDKPQILEEIRAIADSIRQKHAQLQECLNNRNTPVFADLASGVLASAAIAGVFRPVSIGVETYVDGGFRAVVPSAQQSPSPSARE